MLAEVTQGCSLCVGGWSAACLAAYLLGAVPTGLLIARAQGIDIRSAGSGNIGATNVFRSVGKAWGILTLALDVLKGFIPAYAFPRVAIQCGFESGLALGVVCGCLAIAGHNWPIYVGFKGGKGIATSAGVLLGIVPVCVGYAFVAWAVVFAASRYVSAASIIGAVVLVASGWLLHGRETTWLAIVLTALGALAIWRHRQNISRLMHGTENRIEFGKKDVSE